mgnify:CR=1 FL=1
MNKNKGILSLILTVVLIAALGCTAYFGIGSKGTGAAKNIKLGLDLAGGVSITYQVMDEDVLNAIRFHTTGRPNMSLLEKIVFIADYIEPNREKFGGLDEARRLAYLDLDKAMAYILENTIEYVKARGRLLHPLSLEALEYYKNL